MGACASKLVLTLTTILEISKAIENGDHRIALVLLEDKTANIKRYSKADRLKIQELNERLNPPVPVLERQ